MGSKPAPAPVTYIPKPSAPTVFQSVVPEEDFARSTSYVQELKAERETAKAENYAEIGTPEEIRSRMDKRNKVAEAAYESSLPQPEIDYTAGLDPARLNNLDTFLTKLVERRGGQGSQKNKTQSGKAQMTDTAAGVRQAIQAPAPKVASRPAPAPQAAPAPAPAPTPQKNVIEKERVVVYAPPRPEAPKDTGAYQSTNFTARADRARAWKRYREEVKEWDEKYGQKRHPAAYST